MVVRPNRLMYDKRYGHLSKLLGETIVQSLKEVSMGENNRPLTMNESDHQVGEAAFTIQWADTLGFCDEDIQAIFKPVDGSVATHFTFEPLIAQLVKELRLLRELLQEGK